MNTQTQPGQLAVMPEQPRPMLAVGGGIRPIVPQDFDGAWRIANAVCKAGMAPRGMDTAEKCTIAILTGLEIGLTPMAAIQSIAVIGNRPALWGDGALAVVRASPKCIYVREWHDGDGDAFGGVCEARRVGDDKPIIRRFTVMDAKTALLWQKKGSRGEPTPWITYPKRMLQMRARAFALRDAFPDVLKGIGIAEEIADIPEAAPALTPQAPPPEQQSPAAPPSSGEPARPKPPPPEDELPGNAEGGFGEQQPAFDSAAYFEELQDRLAEAPDAATVEEIWTAYDPQARFQESGVDQDIAEKIKKRRLSEIEKAKP